MKRHVGLYVAVAAGLLACAGGPGGEGRPQADFDPDGYPSYGFVWPLRTDQDSPELSERLRVAVAQELEARGYLYETEEPSMRVDLHAFVAQPPPAEPANEISMGKDFFGNPIMLDETGRRRTRTDRSSQDLRPQRELALQVVGASEGRILWQRSSGPWPDDPSHVDDPTLTRIVTTLLAGFPSVAKSK